ncbi:MAG: O-antigen ligase family protein, partial [Solirubrobacteraceae bacterium]
MSLVDLPSLAGAGSAATHALPTAAVIAAPIRDLTSVLLAALVAIALIARAPAARWTAIIAALLIDPLLLAGTVLEDDRVNRILDHPALLGAGAVAGLVALVVAVGVLSRWPKILPALIAIAIPLRLPITLGGDSVNLLLPLYGLIGAGAIAFAVRARARGRERADSWDLRSGPPPRQVITDAWTARSLSGAAALVPMFLAASVAVYALRIPFSLDPDRGVQDLCFFLVPFAAMYVVLREVEWDRPQLIRVAIAIAVLGLVAVALGDYEFQTGNVLWHQNIVDESTLNSTVRVNSLFFDPNIYGRFLMVILIGVLALLAWGARGMRIVWLAVLFVLLWTGMFVTYSQSSMLGLLVAAIVLLGLRFGRAQAAAATATLVVAGLFAIFALGGVLHIHVGSSEGFDNSTAGRGDLIKGGVQLFEKKPVFGWGAGAYRKAYRQDTKVSTAGAVAASHTIPITIAAEEGVVGLVVYIGLIVTAIVALLRRAREQVARAAIAAAFVALVLHSWLYAAFLEDPFTWALLAVGLSLGAEALAGRDAAAEARAGALVGTLAEVVDAQRTADDERHAGVVVSAAAAEQVTGTPARPHTPHDITGPVTLVDVGEGAGPGAAIGESGRAPGEPDGGHGAGAPPAARQASV